MNREEIARMAQECHLIGMRPHLDGIYEESLERFATLVAAHEREACAKVCAMMEWGGRSDEAIWKGDAADDCADAIRARGNE